MYKIVNMEEQHKLKRYALDYYNLHFISIVKHGGNMVMSFEIESEMLIV